MIYDCILDMWVLCSEYLDPTYSLYFRKQFRFTLRSWHAFAGYVSNDNLVLTGLEKLCYALFLCYSEANLKT